LIALSAPALASGVYLLRSDGSGRAFSGQQSVQNAIDAASDGDVVLVGPNTGPSYLQARIQGKSITLMSLPSTNVLLNGGIEIFGVAAGQRVIVSGLQISNLVVHDNAGAVHVQYVVAQGVGGHANTFCPGYAGYYAAELTNSSDVTLYSCQFLGQDGDPDYDLPQPGGGGEGGKGLHINVSKVGVYNCIAQGGAGGDGHDCPGPGGVGCSVSGNSFVLLSSCTIKGGTGGGAYQQPGVGAGAAGGDGLSGGGAVHHVATSFTGGSGGAAYCGFLPCNGPAGQATAFSGSLVAHSYAPTIVFGPALAASDAAWNLLLGGAVGESVYLTGSLSSIWQWAPALQSVRTLPFPFFLPEAPVLLAAQQLNAQYTFTSLGSQAFRRYEMQAVCVDAQGTRTLSNPFELLHLNRNVGPDCNGNGVNDLVEILEGTAPDANGNLVPDGCPGG
jgi:hypothetical protein